MSDVAWNKWVQSRLTAHGLAVGGIDGIIGDTTRKAIRVFQSQKRLPVTGEVDGRTQDALRASASLISAEAQARIGDIDTPAAPSELPAIVSSFWPRQSAVRSVFGEPGTDQVTIEPGYEMYLAWSPATRVRGITVHRKVAESVRAALARVADDYSLVERGQLGLNIFGGSFNVRRMRGGKAFSMHSWGIALDFDPQRNGLLTRSPEARLSHPDAAPFWDAWKAQGALPLGEAIGRDWMHVQFARL